MATVRRPVQRLLDKVEEASDELHEPQVEEWVQEMAMIVDEVKEAVAACGLAFAPSHAGFLNAVYTELRLALVAKLVDAGERQRTRALENARTARNAMQAEFLSLLQAQTSDKERAAMLAKSYTDELLGWLQQTVVGVAADIRAHVLAESPDPAGAAQRAYDRAFVERRWEEVLEYAMDVNEYMRRQLDAQIRERQDVVVRTWRPKLVLQFHNLLDELRDTVARWGRQNPGSTHLEDFSDFLALQSGEEVELLVQRFPIMADFIIESGDRFP